MEKYMRKKQNIITILIAMAILRKTYGNDIIFISFCMCLLLCDWLPAIFLTIWFLSPCLQTDLPQPCCHLEISQYKLAAEKQCGINPASPDHDSLYFKWTLLNILLSSWSVLLKQIYKLFFSKVQNSPKKDKKKHKRLKARSSSFHPFTSFGFSSLLHLAITFPPLRSSISFGGRYYVIVRGIEHRSRGSGGPMNYWWESRRDPPRPAHFTWSSPHCRVNQANGRERKREGKKGAVHCLVGGHWSATVCNWIMDGKRIFFFLSFFPSISVKFRPFCQEATRGTSQCLSSHLTTSDFCFCLVVTMLPIVSVV